MKSKFVYLCSLLLCYISSAQQPEDPYQYWEDPAYPSSAESSVNMDCDGLRENIYNFNPIQREMLNNCMLAYITSEINHDWNPGDSELDKWHVITHHRSEIDFWHNEMEVGFFQNTGITFSRWNNIC